MRSAPWLGLVCLLCGASCERHAEEETRESPAPPGPSVVAAPSARGPDQLAPGELLEGSKKAFGITLPRDLRVDGSFADVLYASGERLTVHQLAAYFQARLSGGGLREGPDAATFEHVHVGSDSEREMLVAITRDGSGVRVEVRDSTPPPVPALPNESARWRKVGLTPQGKLADPTHLD
jgi:hypothetical protein